MHVTTKDDHILQLSTEPIITPICLVVFIHLSLLIVSIKCVFTYYSGAQKGLRDFSVRLLIIMVSAGPLDVFSHRVLSQSQDIALQQ